MKTLWLMNAYLENRLSRASTMEATAIFQNPELATSTVGRVQMTVGPAVAKVQQETSEFQHNGSP